MLTGKNLLILTSIFFLLTVVSAVAQTTSRYTGVCCSQATSLFGANPLACTYDVSLCGQATTVCQNKQVITTSYSCLRHPFSWCGYVCGAYIYGGSGGECLQTTTTRSGCCTDSDCAYIAGETARCDLSSYTCVYTPRCTSPKVPDPSTGNCVTQCTYGGQTYYPGNTIPTTCGTDPGCTVTGSETCQSDGTWGSRSCDSASSVNGNICTSSIGQTGTCLNGVCTISGVTCDGKPVGSTRTVQCTTDPTCTGIKTQTCTQQPFTSTAAWADTSSCDYSSTNRVTCTTIDAKVGKCSNGVCQVSTTSTTTTTCTPACTTGSCTLNPICIGSKLRTFTGTCNGAGTCSASCSYATSDTDCSAIKNTATCPASGCQGSDYYSYPSSSSCSQTCSQGACQACTPPACTPSISKNDPRCSLCAGVTCPSPSSTSCQLSSGVCGTGKQSTTSYSCNPSTGHCDSSSSTSDCTVGCSGTQICSSGQCILPPSSTTTITTPPATTTSSVFNPVTTSTTPFTPSCTGNVALTLSPNPALPSTTVLATASGINNCNGQTVNIVDYQGCSVGNVITSCQVSGSGCTAGFTSPGAENQYGYYACIDGLSSQKATLTVSSTVTSVVLCAPSGSNNCQTPLVQPGESVDVIVSFADNRYAAGENVGVSLKINGQTWTGCVVNDKRWKDTGWNGEDYYYTKGYAATIQSSAGRGSITAVCQIPSNLAAGVYDVAAAPTLLP